MGIDRARLPARHELKYYINPAELEALQGSLVCVKDRRGNYAIGVLEALDKQSSRFFDSFSFSIQRVNYVEEVTYD